jgi:sugar phosphate isomerase/epimerase
MNVLSRLCIHSITTKPWNLEACCAAYAAAGVPAITVWRQALEPYGSEGAARILRSSGLRVTSLCRGGFFPALDAAGRQRAIDDNRRAIAEAHAIGAPHVVLVCGAVPGMALAEARDQIADGIAAVLPDARAAGVRLAIEPLHPQYAADRSAVNTMAQARRLCAALNGAAPVTGVGSAWVGIAVDVYHVWWDDALREEIRLAAAAGLLHAFHVCDWKVRQSDPLNDRGLMGEGVIDNRDIRTWMDAAGFRGDIEVEVFSERWWATDQREWLARIIAAYRGHVAGP